MSNIDEILKEIGPFGSFARDYKDLQFNDREDYINYTIGYMLMVNRNKIITKFKKEFSSIRHGNYDEFYEFRNRNYKKF